MDRVDGDVSKMDSKRIKNLVHNEIVCAFQTIADQLVERGLEIILETVVVDDGRCR
jgi:hypothetical protein